MGVSSLRALLAIVAYDCIDREARDHDGDAEGNRPHDSDHSGSLEGEILNEQDDPEPEDDDSRDLVPQFGLFSGGGHRGSRSTHLLGSVSVRRTESMNRLRQTTPLHDRKRGGAIDDRQNTSHYS